MAVDLIGYSKVQEHVALQEAATAGLRAMEQLVHHLSSSHKRPLHVDYMDMTDITVSKFQKVISMLDRTGHARFRRGPTSSPSTSTSSHHSTPLHDLNLEPPPDTPQPQPPFLDFTKPTLSTASHSATQPLSSLTGEESVNCKHGPSILINPPPPVNPPSSSKPPKCPTHSQSQSQSQSLSHSHSAGASASRCHCSKKRKYRAKRTIRVPAISSKIADIPADDHSWRKYGQKPIKGSPHPRSYYKCSAVRGCPARKHVERDPLEPSTLIVTYEGEHQHAAVAATPFISSA